MDFFHSVHLSEAMKTKHNHPNEERINKADDRETTLSGFSIAEVLYRISIPTFIIDRKHTVIHWNRAMENLSGIPASAIIGTKQHWRAFYPSKRATMADFIVGNMHEEVIATFFEGKYRKSQFDESSYETEDYFPTLGGKGRWLLCTATAIPDANGRIIAAVESVQDISERKRAEDSLRESEQKYKEMSITDSLTKLYNSRHFFRQLKSEIERSERYGHPLSVVLLDVDNFKKYNDTYGHLEGDNALLVIADVIRKTLRSTDNGFRFGGEEFTIILPETDIDEALEVAERLRKNIANAWLSPLSKLKSCVTASIGVSRHEPGELISSLLGRTDKAMYSAKEKGKNRVCVEIQEQRVKQMQLFAN